MDVEATALRIIEVVKDETIRDDIKLGLVKELVRYPIADALNIWNDMQSTSVGEKDYQIREEYFKKRFSLSSHNKRYY